MLKKTINFTDHDGQQQTEDHYFNLTRAEVIEIEMEGTNRYGSFTDNIQAMIRSTDGRGVIKAFKEIVRKSYGRRSPDGKRFYKREEDFEDFVASAAYDALFEELLTTENGLSDFITALLPKEPEDRKQAAPQKVAEVWPPKVD